MVLREGDGGIIQRPGLETGIDVARKGKERRPFRLLREPGEAICIQLGELRRDIHQGRQLFLGQSRRGRCQYQGLLGEARLGHLYKRQRPFIV